MNDELKKQLETYYEKVKERKEIVSKIATKINTKSINEDKINNDLGYIAGFLLEQKGFNFDKDRTFDKDRLKVRKETKQLQRCYFRCSTWYDVMFINSYRDVNSITKLLPNKLTKSIMLITNIINHYNEEITKFNEIQNKDKTINLNVPHISSWGDGLIIENITKLNISNLTNPENYIEDDDYFNEALKYLNETKDTYKNINNSFDVAMEKINVILHKYNDILVLRDL